jgi:hypothetical protein
MDGEVPTPTTETRTQHCSLWIPSCDKKVLKRDEQQYQTKSKTNKHCTTS